jgi:mannosyltransferase OCH1-like enzyme
MYEYGGIYADLDFMALRSFDTLYAERTHRSDVLLGRMGPDPTWEQSIPNAIYVSKRHAPFWLLLMKEMVSNGPHCRDPGQLTEMTAEYESGQVRC